MFWYIHHIHHHCIVFQMLGELEEKKEKILIISFSEAKDELVNS